TQYCVPADGVYVEVPGVETTCILILLNGIFTKETNPFASTTNCVFLKAERPTFVAFVDPIACDNCTSRAIVLGPVPSVRTGLVPAATMAPLNVIAPAVGTIGVVPDCKFTFNKAPIELEIKTQSAKLLTICANAHNFPFVELLHKDAKG